MKITATFALVLPLLSGCQQQAPKPESDRLSPKTRAALSALSTAERSKINVWVEKNGMLDMKFVGQGSMKDITNAGEYFMFIVHYIPNGETYILGGINDDPKAHVVEFTGTRALDDSGKITIDGHVTTKLPLAITFNQIVVEDGDPGAKNYELLFEPGQHPVHVRGIVTGYTKEEDKK